MIPNSSHHMLTAAAFDAAPPLSMMDIPSHRIESSLMELSAMADQSNHYDKPVLDMTDWLPFAAEKYKISADLRDFVIAPVVLIPSDLPNRNSVAFPFERITEFDTDTGTLAYRSWKCKPTCYEHQNNTVPHLAKGVILDVNLRRLNRAADPMWKVISLCAFDRSKDPILANDILTRKRTAYSMGAYVAHYECSVCGAKTNRPDRPGCQHIDPQRRRMSVYNIGGKNLLAYYNTGPFLGFETSSVAVPAFTGADTNELLSFKDT